MKTKVGPVCKRFAAILGGTPQIVNGVCTVTRIIPHKVTILGRRSRSPLTLAALFSFESIDKNGRALNLGETHLLQQDVNPLFLLKLLNYFNFRTRR